MIGDAEFLRSLRRLWWHNRQNSRLLVCVLPTLNLLYKRSGVRYSVTMGVNGEPEIRKEAPTLKEIQRRGKEKAKDFT